MDIKELEAFAEKTRQNNKKLYNISDDEAMNFPFTIKIMEELGELCDAVLASKSLQRKEKLEKHRPEHLEEEFADVIFTTCILAKNMGVDISHALAKKMDKVEKRGGV